MKCIFDEAFAPGTLQLALESIRNDLDVRMRVQYILSDMSSGRQSASTHSTHGLCSYFLSWKNMPTSMLDARFQNFVGDTLNGLDGRMA